MADSDFSDVVTNLEEQRDSGVYDHAGGESVNNLIEHFNALAGVDDPEQRCGYLESAVRILTRPFFDLTKENRQLKKDNLLLIRRIQQLEFDKKINDELELLRKEKRQLILGQCAIDFEKKVQRYVTRSLTEQNDLQVHLLTLVSLIENNFLAAKRSLLTQRQFEMACNEWNTLASLISWDDDMKIAFFTLKNIRLGPAHPPRVSKEVAKEALNSLFPNRGHLRHSVIKFINMWYS